MAEPGHDALRPWRRRVQPRQIVRTTDDAIVLEFVEDEVTVHRDAERAEDAARQKAVDADALGGMFARDPVRPVGFVLRRQIAPDREITGSLHVAFPYFGPVRIVAGSAGGSLPAPCSAACMATM